MAAYSPAVATITPATVPQAIATTLLELCFSGFGEEIGLIAVTGTAEAVERRRRKVRRRRSGDGGAGDFMAMIRVGWAPGWWW